MTKQPFLWAIAVLITLFTAYYQKKTGPTYPVSGEIKFNKEFIRYKLYRSHSGTTDHKVEIAVKDNSVSGIILWKRYKTADDYTEVQMQKSNSTLFAFLPNQPPAGKLQYLVKLKKNEDEILLNYNQAVIIRHKGDVPAWALIPHIIFIFLSLLFSARAGVEYFAKEKKLNLFVNLTFITLILGGFIFGPIVQKFAFGAYWTGFPFGHDLTDNKVLIALIGWIIAYFFMKRARKPDLWALIAAIIMMITFLIPHSVLGSELDYNKLDKLKKEQIK